MAETKAIREQKKEMAKLLFLHENLTQKEIAERSGVSEVTISKWVRTENWESYKVSITITKEEQLKNLYRQLAVLNNAIANRSEEEGVRYATTAEADTISKLANAIEKMESDVGVADMVNVFKKFLNWVRKHDVSKVKEILPLFDLFVKENLR